MLKLDTYGALPTTVKAEFLPDGRVAVRDVPIFSETLETDPSVATGARELRGPDWLQRCLELHEARARDGHTPPLNLRHSFDGPQKVGTYRLRRIAAVKVNPQDPRERATVFGDEIFDSRDAFERAKDHEHRSPEISPDWPDEFGPLALLREASPFNKYPNVKAEAPEAVALVAAAEAFEARGGWVGQAWRRPREIQTTSPRGAAGEQFYSTKEGDMPAPDVKDKGEKKAPSVDERMEAMFSKFQETMMAKFAEMCDGLVGKKDEKPELSEEREADKDSDLALAGKDGPSGPKAGTDQKKGGEELKGPEHHGSSTPEASLPPAVSQARQGEAFAARMEKIERENIALKQELTKQTRERAAEHYAAEGEKLLTAADVSVTDELRTKLREEAVEGGKKAVEKFCALAAMVAKGRPVSRLESFGVLAGGLASSGEPEDLKQALETFGALPGAKQAIRTAYADWCVAPASIRRFGFKAFCEGEPTINPNALEPVAGRRKV